MEITPGEPITPGGPSMSTWYRIYTVDDIVGHCLY